MSDRSRVRILRVFATAGGLSAVVGTIFFVSGGYPELLLSEGGAFVAFAVFFAVLVWRVADTEPRNAVVWIMTATAFLAGVYNLAFFAASLLSPEPVASDLISTELISGQVTPADLPPLALWIILLTLPPVTAAIVTQMTFGLLLFPDGKLPSPRWLWVAIVGSGGIGVMVLEQGWVLRPGSSVPIGRSGALGEVATLMVVAFAIVSVVALIGRFRRSEGTTRQQIKWILWGATILVLALAALIVFEGTALEESLLAVFALAALVFVTSYGIAVAKYRLYDVDVVISRTFVYGSLAVFIAAVYVGVVVGFGFLLDTGDEPNIWLGIAATVVIAIAFQPLRRQLQRMANRLVFGRRATPYEVLSSFSQRIDAVDPDVLRTVARSLAEGTTATSVGIWTTSRGRPQRGAVWPEDAALPKGPALDDHGTWAITHDGELLGYVGLSLGAGQTLSPHDEILVEQVIAGLGLALRNLQLTADLQTRVEQLRESRRRIVSTQDQTRRRLERDLHDGAQQRLVALKIKLGIAASMAEAGELVDVKEILDVVKDEADLTIDSLRTLARGIYPPLLEAEGLGPALTAQMQRAPVPVTVQAAGVSRHSRDLEATVYFCVLEAVQNSIRHARAKSVLVAVGDENDHLAFEVRDDGIGFDPTNTKEGPGLTNIADRLDALGGVLEVDSTIGRGTRIGGRIPILQEVVT